VAFDEPAGGMFVWARLTGPRRDASALLDEAVAAGVAYVPGPAFAVSERHADHLRLSFATPEPDEIAEGVRRLAGVVSASPRG
jgi:DNA-binding transcriptional MocR family regulator